MSKVFTHQNTLFEKFYGLILPILTMILLLGAASIIDRPKIFNNLLYDLIVRIILCVWFCFYYRRLSRISEYHFYPNISFSKSDVGAREKYLYIGIGIFHGVVISIITWWIFHTFIPLLSGLEYFLSGVNGFIAMIPIVNNYWVLKQ
jgi:hypothetical protein